MRESTVEKARGKWKGILPMFGVPVISLDGKQHPCPHCGGLDRFRFDDLSGSGSFYCNQCGPALSGIELIRRMKGWDFATAAAEIDKIVGTVPAGKIAPPRDGAKEREWCNKLWRGARPITLDDPAGQWLFRRCGLTAFPACLRFHPSLMLRTDDGAPQHFPGMLAKMTAPDDKPTILHRTILETGRDTTPRILMPGQVAKGSAVRLMPMDGEEGGIGEGIETSFSAASLHGIPVWAALNATLLEQWEPPAHLRRIVIFIDADANYRGQLAGYRLANRLMARKDPPRVEVCEPNRPPPVLGPDFNDVWQARRAPQMQAAE